MFPQWATIAMLDMSSVVRREPNYWCRGLHVGLHVDPQASHDCRYFPNIIYISPTGQRKIRTGENTAPDFTFVLFSSRSIIHLLLWSRSFQLFVNVTVCWPTRSIGHRI